MPASGAAGSAARLDICDIPSGSRFGRIYFDRFPDPLGFGKTQSRFSDPRRRVEASRFGVLYLGSSLDVCFLEAVLRDQRDGHFGDFPLDESELLRRRHAVIEVDTPLRLVDLRGDGPVRMGISSEVARGRRQSFGRRWSVEMHEHPELVDGIIYPSRLNGEVNLAIYGRAVWKLAVAQTTPLIAARGLARVLDKYLISLV